MKYLLLPDGCLEKHLLNESEDFISSNRYHCLLDKTLVSTLVRELLEESLESVRDSALPDYQRLDPYNGKERRDKAGGHVKIILESLSRNPDEFDQEFIKLGLDMTMVNHYFQERRKDNWYYRTGLVIEKQS